MVSFAETLILSAVMGFSIYLSLPLVLRKDSSMNKTKLLNAIAIGILIFLMGDVFSDVSPTLYNGSLYGYGTSAYYDAIFAISLTFGFMLLYFFENRSKSG